MSVRGGTERPIESQYSSCSNMNKLTFARASSDCSWISKSPTPDGTTESL